jgi:hypothetical protein
VGRPGQGCQRRSFARQTLSEAFFDTMVRMSPGSWWKGRPAIGMVHKNGERIYGTTPARALDLVEAGTPSVSSLRRTTVTERVKKVKFGSRLSVTLVGEVYEVRDRDGLVGNLSWGPSQVGKPDPRTGTPFPEVDGGTLVVERVTVSDAGEVVNLGGTITP